MNLLRVKFRWGWKARLLVDASSLHDDDDCVTPWIYSPEFSHTLNSTIISDDFPTVMMVQQRSKDNKEGLDIHLQIFEGASKIPETLGGQVWR